MVKKILLGCFEVPGFGGASTASYKLFELMRSDGLDVTYLNIIAENDVDYLKYVFGENFGNPKGLQNVYNYLQNVPYNHLNPELSSFINKVSPDIIVGVGWIAALLMKRAAPKKNLIYITTGCEQIKAYIKRKQMRDFISFYDYARKSKNRPGLSSRQEYEAVNISNFVITHSNSNLFLYQYFFHSQVGKIYNHVIWFAEWIYEDALDYSRLKKPFSEREIDVIFVASDWSRPEKNYKLVKKIVSRLRGLNIHIVGEAEKKHANAKHHGLIARRGELFNLLGNTKTIVSPSLCDAAPGILFEASAMGCNIITSKNCGNWKICNANLLVDPFNLNNFSKTIPLSLSKKYEDNIDYFIGTNSYKNLINTILVF